MAAQHRGLTIAGWVLTWLLAMLFNFSAATKFVQPTGFADAFVDKLGYPAALAATIGVVELACVVLYLAPQTAVLGAILLTGYLGGAIATHVRVGDAWYGPFFLGMLVWLALFLREPRVRALLPWLAPAGERGEQK